ncbi:MAG: hypothetical protein R3E62_07000 [Pseudomonadales bacterium]|jgi:hypothetical protein
MYSLKETLASAASNAAGSHDNKFMHNSERIIPLLAVSEPADDN